VELSKGLEPGTIPETSKLCPEDSLYLGFSSLARLLQLSDDVEMVQSAAGPIVGVSAYRRRDRQLRETAWAQAGSDAAAVLRPRRRIRRRRAGRPVPVRRRGALAGLRNARETGFDLRIAQFDRETLAAQPGLAPRDIEYQGHAIHILRSDDGNIRSFRASVGAFRIFSTSQAALQRSSTHPTGGSRRWPTLRTSSTGARCFQGETGSSTSRMPAYADLSHRRSRSASFAESSARGICACWDTPRISLTSRRIPSVRPRLSDSGVPGGPSPMPAIRGLRL
jgi:hypothetical protein